MADNRKSIMKLIYMTIIAVFFIIVMCIYSVTNTAYGKNTESNCVIQKIYTPDKETLLETKLIRNYKMQRLPEIAARLEAISVEVEALSDVALTEGNEAEATLAQIEALDSEFNNLKEEKERLEKVQARIDEIVASRVKPAEAVVEAQEQEHSPQS